MAIGSSDPHTDAALAHDMMSLNTLLARPPSGTLLDEWKGSIKNLPIFKGTVFGSIRWLKTMDPLLTPKHADAFEIRLTHTEKHLDLEGGAHWVTLPALDLPPSKWDGPDNDEYYRVSFVRSGLVDQRIYSLNVSFTAQARWESRNPLLPGEGFHSIEPLGREFSVPDIYLLDPFEVKHRIVMP
jgi:hypothetical protein